MRRFSLTIALSALIACALPSVARAATLAITPVDASVVVGESINVSVILDSVGESINVVAATITYPTDLLELVNLERGSSTFLSLWVEEPAVDTRAGNIRFAGGVPNGRVALNAPVLGITFRALATGAATLAFDPGTTEVRRNDGSGSRATLTLTPTLLTLTNLDGHRPLVSSPTHPNADAWSSQRTAEFRFALEPNAQYSFAVSRNQFATPDDVMDQTTGVVQEPNLEDGLWTFALKERLDRAESWGPVVRRSVRIDATPPGPIEAHLTRASAGQWILAFLASDAESGIAVTRLREQTPVIPGVPFWWRGDWRDVTNPATLAHVPDLSLLTLETSDLAGNIRRLSILGPQVHQRQADLTIALGLVLIAGALTFAVRRIRRA